MLTSWITATRSCSSRSKLEQQLRGCYHLIPIEHKPSRRREPWHKATMSASIRRNINRQTLTIVCLAIANGLLPLLLLSACGDRAFHLGPWFSTHSSSSEQGSSFTHKVCQPSVLPPPSTIVVCRFYLYDSLLCKSFWIGALATKEQVKAMVWWENRCSFSAKLNNGLHFVGLPLALLLVRLPLKSCCCTLYTAAVAAAWPTRSRLPNKRRKRDAVEWLAGWRVVVGVETAPKIMIMC